MRKLRRILFKAFIAVFLASGFSACSSLGGYWGLHGNTELISDGHGGYYPPPPHRPGKPSKPPKPHKKKKHKRKKHHHDWWY